jgi:Ca2+-binding EF-hand superfamily protein
MSGPAEVVPLTPEEEAEVAQWQAIMDQTHNKEYYFNSTTNVTTWHYPAVLQRRDDYMHYRKQAAAWQAQQAAAAAAGDRTKVLPVNTEAAVETAQLTQGGVLDRNGELPPLDPVKFAAMFAKWDADDSKAIDENELYEWMCAMNRHLPPTLETAQSLINSHDQNGDGVLQMTELQTWLSKGAKMGVVKRRQIKQQSETFKHAMNFLERVVMSCTPDVWSGPTGVAPTAEAGPAVTEEPDRQPSVQDASPPAVEETPPRQETPKPAQPVVEPPPEPTNDTAPPVPQKTPKKAKTEKVSKRKVDKKKLKEHFSLHDENGDMKMDSLELMRWMTCLNPSNHPSTATVRAMIAQHDTDGDEELDYIEFEKWVIQASGLSEKQKASFRKRGVIAEQTLDFLNILIEKCSISDDGPDLGF